MVGSFDDITNNNSKCGMIWTTLQGEGYRMHRRLDFHDGINVGIGFTLLLIAILEAIFR